MQPTIVQMWQGAIEPLDGVAVVGELLLKDLAGLGIENRDLLLTRVQVTSHQGHERGLLSVGAAAVGLAEPSNSAGPFS
jgi:hypothetical protein